MYYFIPPPVSLIHARAPIRSSGLAHCSQKGASVDWPLPSLRQLSLQCAITHFDKTGILMGVYLQYYKLQTSALCQRQCGPSLPLPARQLDRVCHSAQLSISGPHGGWTYNVLILQPWALLYSQNVSVLILQPWTPALHSKCQCPNTSTMDPGSTLKMSVS